MTRALKRAVGDTAPSILFNMIDDDENAIPITDGVVYAKIRKDGATSNTNDSNNTCTIVSGPNGQARYDFVNTDLPSAGKYYLQLQCTLSSGRGFTNKENTEIQVKEKY